MRHVRNIGGILLSALAMALLIIYGERLWLDSQVVPQPGTTRTYWIDGFMQAAFNYGLYISVAAVLLWYVIAEFGFGVVEYEQGWKRGWWLVIGTVATVACFAIGFLMTERTRAGGQWAWIFYVLNPVLLYWIATALFSPDAFKYTAPGARTLRFWR